MSRTLKTMLPHLGGAVLLLACTAQSVCATDSNTIPETTQTTPTLNLAAYEPQDAVERGLWMEVNEAERTLHDSNFVIRDPALNTYVRDVLCRTVGQNRCALARIYIVRTPYFNASMAPNGMLQVWTGLLLRMRNEAQLATVLGHEFAHFEQHHGTKIFKEVKAKTSAMAWLSFLPYGIGLIGQIGMIGSVYQFSRDMEREADTRSIGYIGIAGYNSVAAPQVWVNMRAEMDATALARKQKSHKDRNGGFFATHPNSAERITYLTELAAHQPSTSTATGENEYRTALAPWWPQLIDDQIKLNDFGGTEFLLTQLAGGKWTGDLLFARGELYRARGAQGDHIAAVGFYRDALATGFDLPEVKRGLGLALLKSGALEEGRGFLKQYLTARPDSGDHAMLAMLAGGN